MKVKTILTLFLASFSSIIAAQNNGFFYRTIESTRAKDSILNELKSKHQAVIELSNPCYWESRDSLNINYCNSYLLVYEDSSGISKSILITEFFILRRESIHPVYQYFNWNKLELLQTKLRPDKRDLVRRPIDTAVMLDLGYNLGDTLSFMDSVMLSSIGPSYEYYSKAKDGLPNQYITISTKETVRQIQIDQSTLFPNNYYYQFNCQKPVYTFRILLENEFKSLIETVDYYLEKDELSLFESAGRLDLSKNYMHFEKVYEEQINNLIDEANQELKTDWSLHKNTENRRNRDTHK